MGLNVGMLDRQYTIQRPAGLDAEGYETVEADVWGHKRFASGSESLRASTPVATVTHVVTMRYRDDLRANWRLVEQDTSPEQSLQIVSFGDPTGDAEELRVYVVELQ